MVEPSRLLPALAPLVSRYETLDVCEATVFGLLPDLTLGYFNTGWLAFAAANGLPAVSERWGLGCAIADAIRGPVRDYYLEQYRASLERAQPWEHRYECSSAERRREMILRTYPGREGLLVVTSAVIDVPHEREASSPANTYRDPETQLLRQCGHCRRFHHSASRWDWVPAWVAAPPERITHGLCELCFEHYYPA